MSENKAKKCPQYRAAMFMCLGALGTGTTIGWSSNILQDLERGKLNDFKMSSEEISWVTSIVFLGAMVVCIPIGFMADAIGRKLTALITVVPFVVGWPLIMFSKNMAMIYVGRFFVGIAGGSFSVIAPLYISEIAVTEMRGKLGTIFHLFVGIGILYAGIFGNGATMRVYHYMLLVVPIIYGVFFLFLSETPVYLIRNQKEDKLSEAYMKLRGIDYNPSNEINATKEQIARERPGFWKVMQTAAAVKGTLICFVLMFLYQISGITAVVFYLRDITFIEDEWYPQWSVICLGMVQVAGVISCCRNMKESGIRTLLEDSCLSLAVVSGVVGMFFTLKDNGSYTFDRLECLAEAFLAMFVATFSYGLGPISWLAPFELLPPEVKVGCGSAVATFGWFLAFLITKFYFSLATAIGLAIIFYVIAGIMFIGFIFVLIFFPETNGKTFAEIQAELEGADDD